MKLPTPDCPNCSRRTFENLAGRFACPADCHIDGDGLPYPPDWWRSLAEKFGANARDVLALPNYAYLEARWAARAAMRAKPELRP